MISILQDDNTDIGLIRDNLWKLGAEVIIKGEEKVLDDGFERGIHGIIVRAGDRSAIALSTLSVEGNLSLDHILDTFTGSWVLRDSQAKNTISPPFILPGLHMMMKW